MGLSPNIKPPAHETHPGIYASRASETTYVIRCGERSVLVDAGFFRNAEAHLVNFEASGIDLASIAAVLVTHFHVDHAAGLAHVRERLGCPIIAHKNAAPAIQTGDPVVTAAQIPYLGWDFPFPPCPVDEIVEDGDTVTVGDTTFDVIHIPGHTPGCAGYLWDSNLITGDVLFPDGRLGWADVHWGSNLLDTLETMDRIDALAPSVPAARRGQRGCQPYQRVRKESGSSHPASRNMNRTPRTPEGCQASRLRLPFPQTTERPTPLRRLFYR